MLRAGFTRRAAAGPGVGIHGRDCAVNVGTPRLSGACDRFRNRGAGRARDSARPRSCRGARCSPCRLRPSLAFGLHLLVSQNELPLETRYYSIFLVGFFGAECAGSGGAAVVGRPARVDARHAPDPRRDRRAAGGVGDDHLGAALAADALFSEPRGCAPESHRRPRGAFRQHLALADSAHRRLRARRRHRAHYGRLHRLVQAGALLGNAGAESRRPDPRDRLDSARHGRLAERDLFRRRPDRARGLVSGHDADRLRHFQHARFVSRRRAHARRGRALSHLPRRDSRRRCRTFSSACSWGWAPRS